MANNSFSLKYTRFFSEQKFLKKLQHYAGKLGTNLLFYAIILYYLISDRNIPLKTRLIFMAALGYFILPMDLISDLIPGLGFTDDLTFIMYAISTGNDHITDDIKQKAKNKLRTLFTSSHNEDYSFDEDNEDLLSPIGEQ
ncbi:MAG: hypothetical protein C0598_03980 [Marinilabiliales bacterium]|nr:MAG: hypothetical protein C0598_03980 [Marinilabiliales bacterium]